MGVSPDTALQEWVAGWLASEGWRGPEFVYRLYGVLPGAPPEWEIAPIYVGVTRNLKARMRSHSKRWWWAAVRLDLSEVTGHATRAEALAEELAMIRELHPPMNKDGRLAELVKL